MLCVESTCLLHIECTVCKISRLCYIESIVHKFAHLFYTEYIGCKKYSFIWKSLYLLYIVSRFLVEAVCIVT